MATNFPASLDAFTNPSSNSSVANPSHAQQHADANDAIEALEAKVGITGSAVTTSHDYKIAQLESLVTSSVAGAKSIYQDVRNQSGSALSKATPVYVSGSEGASGKMLISAASNAAESTSSKTMGITTSAIANNSNGQVISEGILEGIDTTGAADGDPVWLGTNGAKIYGLANKPSAPAHLVFLGVVIRGGQALTGSMYVKIQNGFELQELHNVQISSLINGNVIAYDSAAGTWKNTNTLQSTASTVPLVIKASASQTANLQEWRNSDNALIAYIDPTHGRFVGDWVDVTVARTEYLINKTDNGPYILTSPTNIKIINRNSASNNPLIIQGMASQTGDLQQWQNSSGTVLAKVNAVGNINAVGLSLTSTVSGTQFTVDSNYGNITSRGGAIGFSGAASLNIGTNYNAQSAIVASGLSGQSVPTVIIKAVTSQSGNLTEWQNSSGAVVASIDSLGKITSYNRDTAGGNNNLTISGYYNGSTSSLDLQSNGITRASLISSGTIGTDSSFRIHTRINDVLSERFRIATTGRVGFNTNNPSSGLHFLNTIASDVGIIVQGAASQTANLQEWQDSGGTVLASISNTGNITLASNLGINMSGANTGIYGAGGEWGVYRDGANFRLITPTNLYLASAYGGSVISQLAMQVLNPSAATVGLIVKGAASQTANLQEWQNSSGTVLSAISATGKISLPGSMWHTLNSTETWYKDGAALFQKAVSHVFRRQSDDVNLFTIGNNGNTSVLLQSSSAVGLIIKGAASQTANLQEWQNSNGSVLLSVSSDGFLNKTGTLNIGPILSFADPGVGNETKFVFNKTNDSAYLTVKEVVADKTFYEFGMWDNALDSQDYFQWSMGQWSGGTGYGWMPIQLGSNSGPNGSKSQTLRFTGEQSVFWSPILTGTNTPYYTTTLNHSSNVNHDIDKYYPDTSATRTIPRTNASGGATLNIDLSGYTYSSRMGYRITVNSGGTTFDYSTYGGDNSSGTAIAITVGSWQTLSNGTKIKINGTPAASDDWQFLAFPTPRVSFGGSAEATTLVTIKPSASDKGLVIRGSASQTANLQEWHNSSGSVISAVGPYGNAGFGGSPNINTYLFAKAADPANKGFIVQGAASQVANLTEWQNSSGTVLANIDATGRFLSTRPFRTDDVITAGSQTSTLGQISAISSSSTRIGLVIQGAASQTADLQQWQDSSGTVLGMFNAYGTLTANNRIYAGWAAFGSGYGTSASASNVVLIAKGAASQTANLQEWQNSSGSTLAYMDPNGNFIANYVGLGLNAGLVAGGSYFLRINYTAGNTINLGTSAQVTGTQVQVTNPTASNIALTVKGAASQTANLQEWQDGSGNILTSIKNKGEIESTLTRSTRTNYSSIPAGTSHSVATNKFGWLARWFGGSTANGTVSAITGATDGPIPELTTYLRKTWTAVRADGAHQDISFSLSNSGTSGYPVSPGDIHTVSFYFRHSWTDFNLSGSQFSRLYFNYFDSSGTQIQSAYATEFPKIDANTWTRISDTSTAPANAAYLEVVHVYYSGTNAISVNGTLDVTGQLVEKIGSLGEYFDGTNNRYDSKYDAVSAWTGTANSSTSTVSYISQSTNPLSIKSSSNTITSIDQYGAIVTPAITVSGVSIAKNISMSSGYRYFVDTTAARTLTLPASPLLGDEIQIFDASNLAGTNSITVDSNNAKIEGVIEQYSIDVNGAAVTMIYTGSTFGWKVRI